MAFRWGWWERGPGQRGTRHPHRWAVTDPCPSSQLAAVMARHNGTTDKVLLSRNDAENWTEIIKLPKLHVPRWNTRTLIYVRIDSKYREKEGWTCITTVFGNSSWYWKPLHWLIYKREAADRSFHTSPAVEVQMTQRKMNRKGDGWQWREISELCIPTAYARLDSSHSMLIITA